jgi:3-dehydroquinate synthase
MSLSQSGFPIFTGEDALVAFSDWLSGSGFKHGLILCDPITFEHCLPSLKAAVPAVSAWPVLTVPAGEEAKTFSVATELWNRLTELNITRRDLLLNLGGGALTDLGGFVASLYLRGIPFVHVPTTLLGMVDAALGGKTAIDLGPVKNRIGTIVFPQCTVCDPVFLHTLPDESWLDGLTEAVKHAIIGDEGFFRLLSDSRNVRKTLVEHLDRIQSVKLQIVEADPFESGLRKVLNFGHSIGHAIESAALEAGMQGISHGRAVAIGMVVEVRIAVELSVLSPEDEKEIVRFIGQCFGMPVLNWINPERLLHFLRLDKKNTSAGIFMSLPDRIGSCIPAVEVSEELVRKVLAETIAQV